MRAMDVRRYARRALRGQWVRMAGLQLLATAVLGAIAAVIGFAALAPLTLSALQGLDHMLYGAESIFGELTQIPPAFFVIVVLGLILATIAASLMSVGMAHANREVLRGKEAAPAMLFPMWLLGKALLMNLARFVLILGQLMLLIVPGVIAAYRYAMADYLLGTHHDMGPIEALRLSRLRMKDHKLELFELQLSFLGWLALCLMPPLIVYLTSANFLIAVSLHILSFAGMLFLAAYWQMAATIFFRHLNKNSHRRKRRVERSAE